MLSLAIKATLRRENKPTRLNLSHSWFSQSKLEPITLKTSHSQAQTRTCHCSTLARSSQTKSRFKLEPNRIGLNWPAQACRVCLDWLVSLWLFDRAKEKEKEERKELNWVVLFKRLCSRITLRFRCDNNNQSDAFNYPLDTWRDFDLSSTNWALNWTANSLSN